MARKPIFKHATLVDTNTYPDDGTSPVGSNEWNEAPSAQGMLGFSPTTETITISTNNLPITDSVTVATCAGATDTINTISISDTNEYDVLYLFANTGKTITLTHTSSPSVAGQIVTVSGSNETLSTTKPIILMRKGNFWYGYGGGTVNTLDDIGDVTITTPHTNEILKYDGTNWINNSPDLLVFHVKNTSGATIAKGKAVRITGYDVGTGYPEIALADNTDAATMPAVGITSESIANNATGHVVQQGKLSDIDTSVFTAGDVLYVNASGALTATKPTGVANKIQNIALVLRSHSSNGQIQVGGSGRSNDIPNIANGQIWIGNASDVPTGVTLSGDVTVSNAGVTSISSGVIVNADINASAAIELSKLATDPLARANHTGSQAFSTITGTVPINQGGSGQTTAQAAINALTNTTGVTDGFVLTKNSSGDAVWSAAASGAAPTTLLEFKYQAHNYTTPTYTVRNVNDATTPIQLWVKDIDSTGHNQGVFIRIKKNNAYTDVQIA
jgi:hypothetical protein